MKRLGALIAGAALVGGLGGALIALALGGTSASAGPAQRGSATATAATSLTASRSLAPETIYGRAAPSVVVISGTQSLQVPGSFFSPPSSQKVQIGGSGFVNQGQKPADLTVNSATTHAVTVSGSGAFFGTLKAPNAATADASAAM